MDVSFGTIWEAIARDLPDAVAISEPGRDYTFAEFDDRAARLAAALAAAGVGPGDKVACYLYNGAPYLETVFAAFKLGAAPVNANYRYTEDELTALLADADAAALVFSGGLAANVVRPVSALSTLRLIVRAGSPADIAQQGEARRAAVRDAPELSRPVRRDRAPPRPAPPGKRRALHVHGRNHRQAQGRHLAHVAAVRVRWGRDCSAASAWPSPDAR